MIIIITINEIGGSAGNIFNIYSDLYVDPIFTNISRETLLGGFKVNVDNNTSTIRIVSVDGCGSECMTPISLIPTPTPTPTNTPTPTRTPFIVTPSPTKTPTPTPTHTPTKSMTPTPTVTPTLTKTPTPTPTPTVTPSGCQRPEGLTDFYLWGSLRIDGGRYMTDVHSTLSAAENGITACVELRVTGGAGSYFKTLEPLSVGNYVYNSNTTSCVFVADGFYIATSTSTYSKINYNTPIIEVVDGEIIAIHYMNVPVLNPFMMEFIIQSTDKTLTIPLYNSSGYNMTIDWGDGTIPSSITSYSDSNRIHTYANSGSYTVSINGTCKGIYFNDTGDKLKLRRIIQWGDVGFISFKNAFYGCSNLYELPSGSITGASAVSGFRNTFNGCSSLTTIPTDLFKYNTAVSSNGFYGTFKDCSSLTTIPIDLFRYNTAVSDGGFFDTFNGCSSLTTIPTDLFKYNTAVSSFGFAYTFNGCSSLTTIPTDLFRYNSLVSVGGFRDTFNGCSSLITIPTDLFRYNTTVSNYGFANTFFGCSSLVAIPTDLFRYNTLISGSGFEYTFFGCSSLTTIPTDLFRYNTAVSNNGFYGTFQNCTSLTTIPTDLFRYNTAVSSDGFGNTFGGCTSLTTIPTYLFRYNTAVSGSGFERTFNGCSKLQLNPWIFYANGEQSTRFLDKTISFQNCFDRSTFTGVQGTAPDIWNCNFGIGIVTKTDCYNGNGNSLASLSNYNSIPADWK